MGTWGIRTFDNDDAADWLIDLYESHDLSFIDLTLSKVIATQDYLEAPESAAAIAAAEVVAGLEGKAHPDAAKEEQLDTWIARIKVRPNSRLVSKARKAIDRILTEPSELLELWRDGPDFDAWKASIGNIKERLSSGKKAPARRPARPKRIRYGEGDIFSIPLGTTGHVLGLVARSRSRSPIVFGYFFAPVYDSRPAAEDLPELKASDAVKTLRFGDLHLIGGEWPIIARLSDFDRAAWPLPKFIRRPSLTNVAFLIEYSEDDPGRILGEERCLPSLEGYEDDGLCGAGFVEIVLTKLLNPPQEAGTP